MIPGLIFHDEPCTIDNIGPDWIPISKWAGVGVKGDNYGKNRKHKILFRVTDTQTNKIILDWSTRDKMNEIIHSTGALFITSNNSVTFSRSKDHVLVAERYLVERKRL